MSRIIITPGASAGVEFNNYVIVSGTSDVKGINLALVNKDGNSYEIQKSYPIFGMCFEKTATGPYLYFSA